MGHVSVCAGLGVGLLHGHRLVMVVYVDIPVAMAAGLMLILSGLIAGIALWGWSYHTKGGR